MQEKQPPKSKYHSLYLPALKYQTFNDNDPDMRPWTIRLPDPPPLWSIPGYGLAPEQQFFQYVEEPARLKQLAIVAFEQVETKYEGKMVLYMQLKTFWKMLSDEHESYVDEINFIKRTHWYLRHGYWCFIQGRPTWITPWHFFYLNFYYPNTLKGKRVDYRDEDRITELFEWYCYTCTEVFKELDDDGNAMPNEDGIYEMIDVGYRTCFGSIQPKRRRRGETMKACSKMLQCAIMDREFHAALQANSGDAAEDLYQDNVLPAWKKLPIWLRPIYDGAFDSSGGIFFRPPGSVSNENYTDSWIVWNPSAKEGVNDRRKLHFLVDDEVAKAETNVEKRWAIDKLTLAQGQTIHGYSVHPSTVEEMQGAGSVYQSMWDESDFYKRMKSNGQTFSGLFRIFRKADYGHDGFIDKAGISVTGDPTDWQLSNPAHDSIYHMVHKGSIQYMDEYYDDLLSDPNKHSKYRIAIRKNPRRIADCWLGSTGDLGFNYVLIDQRLSELRRQKKSIRGNLKRRGTKVDWIEDENGRFVVSNLFIDQQVEPVFGDPVWDEDKQSFVPAYRPKYPSRRIAGGDPFDYGQGGKKADYHLSKGGGAVVTTADPNESDKNIRDWDSFQLEWYYEYNPPSLKEYCEDMLSMCIWCDCMINFESNKKGAIKYFIDEGFGGYLWRATLTDGTIRKDYGTYSQAGTKNDMLNATRDFIEYRAHKCNISEYLVAAKSITHPSQLTFNDGFTAVGWALYAAQGSYGTAIERIEDTDVDLQSFYDSVPNMR